MDAYLKHHTLVPERHKNPMSLIMLDIDLFKSVNDTFGRVIGDVVLRAIANAIVKCTRDSDVVFHADERLYVAKELGRSRVQTSTS